MKRKFDLRKLGKSTAHTTFTVAVVAAIIVLNLLFSFFASTRNIFIDLTSHVSDDTLRGMGFTFINKSIDRNYYDHIYTPLPQLYDVIEGTEGEVKILFCSDPDILMADDRTRPVYIMALELQKKFDFITVDTVNASLNPALVEKYKTTAADTISWNNIIFYTPGGEYRVYHVNRFFAVSEESDEEIGYMGELQFATAILSLTAAELPKVCFASGHGETVPSATDEETMAFYSMLTNLGYNVYEIDLDTEEIPEDCYLLILNGTSEDYEVKKYTDINYISPIEKIERFLADHGNLMYFRDAEAGTLKNLEEMLSEWGFSFDNTIVRDTSRCISGTPERVIARYAEDDTLGFAMYEDIASLGTPPITIVESANPITMLWEESGHEHYSNGITRFSSSVLLSSDNARTYDSEGYVVDGDGGYTLMGVSRQYDIVDNSRLYSYVVVSGTDAFTASEYFASTYANYDVLNNIIFGIAREALVIEGLEADLYKQYTDKAEAISGLAMTDAITFTVFTVVVPVVVLAAVGLYVNIRRRVR